MKTIILVIAFLLPSLSLQAQDAKAQILQDEDASHLADAYRAMKAAEANYARLIENARNKYRLDFEPTFSNDFKVALPKPVVSAPSNLIWSPAGTSVSLTSAGAILASSACPIEIVNKAGEKKCFPSDATAEEIAQYHESGDPK
jgi:hypothetical protein